MLYIGICDDVSTDIERLKNMVERYLFRKNFQYKIFVYKDGHLLLDDAEQKKFDLLFLDIDMPGLSGLDLGRELWRKNKKSKIVYVTDYAEYSLKAIDGAHTFWYVLKSELAKKIERGMDDIMSSLQEANDKIMLKTNMGYQTFLVNNIYYFKRDMRKIYAVTEIGKYEIPGTLRDLEQKLKPYSFARSHRSYLVNITQIREFNRRTITINDKNRTSLPVVGDCLEKVQQSIHTYVNKYSL